MSNSAHTPRAATAENILEVAAARAVQMYRTGATEESVYWMLVHATFTADLLLAA